MNLHSSTNTLWFYTNFIIIIIIIIIIATYYYYLWCGAIPIKWKGTGMFIFTMHYAPPRF
jgi:hypothetical protein